MASTSNDERFESGAQDYANYLATPEGRLRADLSFANLQDFLTPPRPNKPLDTLEVGSGTGVTSVRLAQLGIHVTELDSSQAMLDLARQAAEAGGVSDRVRFWHGDAARLMEEFPSGSFDVIVCHNFLEYVDDPIRVLHGAARLLRDTSAILSILVRNQAGEVLKASIQAGDLAAAEANLTAEWGCETLYGGRVRLFTTDRLQAILKTESLALIAERGVRVVADYLPRRISRSSEYARILELERKLGRRPEYAAIARYMQCLARRVECVE